jgi:hypothetical protein
MCGSGGLAVSAVRPMDWIVFSMGNPPDFKDGHFDAVRKVLWTPQNQIISCSDDRCGA